MTPPAVTSASPITAFSLVTRASLTMIALLAMARRTSPFDVARPALTKATSTLKPAFRSARGTSTLGRLAPSPPSSKVVGGVAAVHQGRGFGGENLFGLVDLGVLERGEAVDLVERQGREQLEKARHVG